MVFFRTSNTDAVSCSPSPIAIASGVDRLRQRKQRGRAADLVGELGNDGHVLLPDRDLHGRGLVNAFDHHRRAHLKHPRAAGARANHVDHHFGIEPGALRQHHRLGGGDVVDGHQMVGDEFHPAAIAVFAEIGALPGEVGEQVLALRNGLAVAAGIDDEIANLRLRPGSAQRTIQRNMAGLASGWPRSEACRRC